MATKKGTYTEAVGRRKAAVARVRITKHPTLLVEVNDRDMRAYFPTKAQQAVIQSPLRDLEHQFKVSARIRGGGAKAQAEALRHGIARALVIYQPELRTALKRRGFLKRDPRTKERRKFGLKKARRAPQWSKR